ncbi:(2E,6E)-farnesyl diphosphate synthase [Candidatus Methylospira mobilis]|uniref:(2E,6E)-farnesyl diphosphate synthase n=1 Tax=Candidatus Methylospira mobilis TaxID=1808979 RepID=A0A5Q0BM49_9GAMM|nr:farnesyl diphosphate synthase [Candidatus Methylospira mobilis]QFY44903.1 (2E,6E)-farnesyl diphosphate synthase [Candidatus Methylospira mobilis]WNV06914.1 (2E,6E)-farnesyl diphosphate synthase [Candidatus Methylospira mobilis]
MNPENSLETFMLACQSRVEAALDARLPSADKAPARLHEAMRYSTLGAGKRMRPLLVYATGHALGIAQTTLDGPACAIEFIHVYSLIHDDLPAMDNDDLRRGKPTCHKAYDDATAILAGDALQALAFHVLAHDPDIAVSAENRLAMLETLATASGSLGMVGGQAIDLDSVGKALTLPELEGMHIRKTGALIRASVCLAALTQPGLAKRDQERLDRYAKCIGLSFQIQDDILDEESDTATLGKTQGKDRDANKPTYPALLGMAGAKTKALDLHEEALDSLRGFGETADYLRAISHFIINRRH